MRISKKIKFSKKSRKFILKYNRYDRVDFRVWEGTKGTISIIRKEIRKHYLKEQGHLCAYCRMHNHTSHGLSWDIDHILPKDRYPQFLFQPLNLILACKECNGFKSNKIPLMDENQFLRYKYPQDEKQFSIIHPHFDRYSDNIEIEKVGNYYAYTYLTDKGLETIITCKLSRYSFVESYGTEDIDTINAIEQQVLVNDSYENDQDFIDIPQIYLNEIIRRLHSRRLVIKKSAEFPSVIR
ncbi:HNH endonuclease [Klebsiella pneumoniae]|uniref:HNH endonuclease n=1 Tax=Klebsiella pneumoniae TaxID=573 RepID=UPI000C7AB387|nr:HNH endonuclease [Klebsiella pneumoniae]DAH90862.1 MAG TPA: Restriction endonuclease [Caudoviricetes sp.]HBY0362184.1 HNH endonuclease [Klebsiella pneumoniae subsp. pneumoniae]EIW0149338.1 HNH endonuclease [Klebsiella pneumoniae]EIW1926134.1 HNH endonuclease [Klebsiella pneumoniae]EKX1456780.1 HNH endonuclease [Klebsiella pneumoniae]